MADATIEATEPTLRQASLVQFVVAAVGSVVVLLVLAGYLTVAAARPPPGLSATWLSPRPAGWRHSHACGRAVATVLEPEVGP